MNISVKWNRVTDTVKGRKGRENMAIGKKLPIGIENFSKLLKEDFYYVDKTNFIKDLLANWSEVTLFTRPRRFGKTLNMDMLKCFFEVGQDKSLFNGLNIADEKDLCEKYMGKYPVISVSLKGATGLNFEQAKAMLVSVIAQEIRRHSELKQSEKLNAEDKLAYQNLLELESDINDNAIGNCFRVLSELLEKHYAQKVVILIDEYDVPLDKANFYGYYDEMVALIRNLLGQTLKTNGSMFFAVLTGCLRVSKESIFTGLNNVKVHSITDRLFGEYFGFTDEEVRQMLDHYDCADQYSTAKEWYDGYHFGELGIYCPWDVINFVYDLRTNPKAQPQAYWINTSGNDIVRHLVRSANTATTRKEIEALIAGETVRKEIHQELTYRELTSTIDNIWSVLFTTGYLTYVGEPDGDILTLTIPNQEVRKIFKTQIYEWFNEKARKDTDQVQALCTAFENGDTEAIEKIFSGYLMKNISIRDTSVRKAQKENFYHGFLLGLLCTAPDWAVSSNAESGEGYSDIMAEAEETGIGIVIEVKYSDTDRLEEECVKALKQIENKKYTAALLDDGMTKILKYGIACYKKRCKVMLKE